MVAISHDDAHTKEYLIALPALNQVYVDVDEKYERRRGASLPASSIFKN